MLEPRGWRAQVGMRTLFCLCFCDACCIGCLQMMWAILTKKFM